MRILDKLQKVKYRVILLLPPLIIIIVVAILHQGLQRGSFQIIFFFSGATWLLVGVVIILWADSKCWKEKFDRLSLTPREYLQQGRRKKLKKLRRVWR